ncbi:STY0301 family protein [Stenotrophomonas panacihumi]|uniref:STY0301 family protein n=1 Tax=Stenotrophomonas panacihumi TaxID=676599 RepID=UPI003CCDADE2
MAWTCRRSATRGTLERFVLGADHGRVVLRPFCSGWSEESVDSMHVALMERRIMGSIDWRRIRFLCVALLCGFQFFPQPAHAQSCPTAIRVLEAAKALPVGWGSTEASSNRDLVGLNIIEGRLHDDQSDNAVLKPWGGAAGEALWKFVKPAGGAELWMQCIYEGSGVALTRRVEPKATHCSEKRVAAEGGVRKVLRAFCE